MTTRNDTTTNHSKNISTTHQRHIPQQGTIQHHTEPCIQQHIQQHTEQSTYQTTYQITYEQHTIHIPYNKPNTKQQSTSGPIRQPPKDLTNLSNNMTNRTACKAYNNQPLGATKSSSVKKLNDTVSRREACSLAVFFSFFALAAFECTTRANFWFTGE